MIRGKRLMNMEFNNSQKTEDPFDKKPSFVRAVFGCLPSLYASRPLLAQLVRREVGRKYRGSSLGLLWAFLTPLLQLGLYTLVFGVFLKARWAGEQAVEGLWGFALPLFCGLSVFSMFAEAVNQSPRQILDNANYVKKVVFPLELLSVTGVLTAMFHGIGSLLMCVVMHWVVSGQISPMLLFMPLLLVPYFLVILSVCWLLSALGVYLRDLQQVMPPLMTAFFFLSPIIYSVDVVPAGLRPYYRLNPLCFFVENFRRILLWNEWPDLLEWLQWMFLGLVFMHLSYAVFLRLRKGFADVV